MMRGFVVDLGQTVKRPLSDREIAAVGEVLSSVGLLRDRRKRKRLLRRVREKARSVEIGLKRRNRTTPGQTMLSRNRPWNWTKEEDERLKAFVAQGASVVKVAAALKRKTISVRTRARALGCPFPPLRIARQKWEDTSERSREPRN
jgi:hypothetical protein